VQDSFSELAPEKNTTPGHSPHGDTFQLYLREIGQVKLLSSEEEIALAERIQRAVTKRRMSYSSGLRIDF
jgi:hypothetical protein